LQFKGNLQNGLVLEGLRWIFILYNRDLNSFGVRSAFNSNLAVDYYFTPIGDMVLYVSTNVSESKDNHAETSNTFVSLALGFSARVGNDWYSVGDLDVSIINP